MCSERTYLNDRFEESSGVRTAKVDSNKLPLRDFRGVVAGEEVDDLCFRDVHREFQRNEWNFSCGASAEDRGRIWMGRVVFERHFTKSGNHLKRQVGSSSSLNTKGLCVSIAKKSAFELHSKVI